MIMWNFKSAKDIWKRYISSLQYIQLSEMVFFSTNKWDKLFKNGISKICELQFF